jgi:hypothetical protein
MENTQENIQAMMPLMSTNCRQFCMQKWIKMFHATKYPSKLRGSSGSISILKDPAGGLLSGATKALIHCPQSVVWKHPLMDVASNP